MRVPTARSLRYAFKGVETVSDIPASMNGGHTRLLVLVGLRPSEECR